MYVTKCKRVFFVWREIQQTKSKRSDWLGNESLYLQSRKGVTVATKLRAPDKLRTESNTLREIRAKDEKRQFTGEEMPQNSKDVWEGAQPHQNPRGGESKQKTILHPVQWRCPRCQNTGNKQSQSRACQQEPEPIQRLWKEIWQHFGIRDVCALWLSSPPGDPGSRELCTRTGQLEGTQHTRERRQCPSTGDGATSPVWPLAWVRSTPTSWADVSCLLWKHSNAHIWKVLRHDMHAPNVYVCDWTVRNWWCSTAFDPIKCQSCKSQPNIRLCHICEHEKQRRVRHPRALTRLSGKARDRLERGNEQLLRMSWHCSTC